MVQSLNHVFAVVLSNLYKKLSMELNVQPPEGCCVKLKSTVLKDLEQVCPSRKSTKRFQFFFQSLLLGELSLCSSEVLFLGRVFSLSI